MGAPPDAEGMASMLNDPQFASTLNEALANPAVLDMIIEQNPALREMGPLARQMMRTEEFRRMLTDPNALRQMSQMSRGMRMGGLGGMGMGMGLGGGGGAGGSFPAPGVTDTTPADAAGSNPTPNQTNTTGAGNPTGLPVDQNLLNLLAAGMPNPSANPSTGPNIFAPLFGLPGGQPGSNTNPSTGSGAAGGGSGQESQGPSNQQPQQQGGSAASLLGMDPSQATNDQMRQFFAALAAAGSGASNDITNPPTGPTGNPDLGAGFPSLLPILNQLLNQPGGAGSPGAINPFQPPSSGSPAPPADTRPPEERYEQQLRQLNDMGFFDFDRNVEALRRSGGSVNGAVEYLLTH